MPTIARGATRPRNGSPRSAKAAWMIGLERARARRFGQPPRARVEPRPEDDELRDASLERGPRDGVDRERPEFAVIDEAEREQPHGPDRDGRVARGRLEGVDQRANR